MSRARVRALFLIAGLYDGLLGLGFLAVGPRIFVLFGVTPPNHWAYVQFSAALVLTFGLMFLAVAARPEANRNLIPFGILLKVSYSTIVFYHWSAGGLPAMWIPFAFFDAAFAVLFVWALMALRGAVRIA